MVVKIAVKWNKQSYDVEIAAEDNGAKLKEVLAGLTGVPVLRQKLMAKGAWPGVLKDDGKLIGLKEGHKVMLMGSADTLVVKAPAKFLEDMTDTEAAASGAVLPAGLMNLGNTCYMNSTLQCLHAVPELVTGLNEQRGFGNLSSALATTYRDLERSTKASMPATFIETLRGVFPQFAQRGRQGGFAQQDAEEFFSALLGGLAPQLPSSTSSDSLIDRLFRVDFEETLTCAESEAEEVVSKEDSARKLVCVIQGGHRSTTKVDHLHEGLKLAMQGSLTKHAPNLNRDAEWLKEQTISRVGPYICVQFMRFFWKATPESMDHQGVKCKIQRPISYPETLDLINMCSPKFGKLLAKNRSKYGAQLDELPTAEAAMDVEGTPAVVEEVVDEADDSANQELMGMGLPDKFMGTYELFALVTHKGRSADGGHYIGWVRQDDKRWIVFDDEDVSDATTEFVMALKGGGDEHMAYLAFYRAKQAEDKKPPKKADAPAAVEPTA